MIISVSAETIYVGNLNFTNNNNKTVIINNAMNKTDVENIVKLVQYLKEQNEYSKQHEDYLNSLVQRVSTSEERFTDTLHEVEQQKTNLENELNIVTEKFNNYMNKTDTRIQTLNTRVTTMVEDAAREKNWTIIKIMIGIILAVITVVVIYELHRSKRLYFMFRWLRDNVIRRFL